MIVWLSLAARFSEASWCCHWSNTQLIGLEREVVCFTRRLSSMSGGSALSAMLGFHSTPYKLGCSMPIGQAYRPCVAAQDRETRAAVYGGVRSRTCKRAWAWGRRQKLLTSASHQSSIRLYPRDSHTQF